jgi:hypothetical protein
MTAGRGRFASENEGEQISYLLYMWLWVVRSAGAAEC